MQNKKLLVATLLLVSGSAFAEQLLLQGATEASKAMDKVEAAKEVMANPAEAATNAVKEKAVETVKEAIPAVEVPKPDASAVKDAVTDKTTEATTSAAPAAAQATAEPAKAKVKKTTKKRRKHH